MEDKKRPMKERGKDRRNICGLFYSSGSLKETLPGQ